jgi:hypothetical protein
VGLLSAEELRVAKKSFGYRWRDEKRRQHDDERADNATPQTAVFGNDTWITEAREWWLIAFAHGVEYGKVQRAKELLG